MKSIIVSGTVINEGKRTTADILMDGPFIEAIGNGLGTGYRRVIDAEGMWVIPGLIDDQVHFREPGLTHKATIASESRAAVLGGVTSFMEMPNTVPAATSLAQLEEKYAIAARSSAANYSFFLGASNNNLAEIKAIDPATVCGLKIFMGSSTGDLIVDSDEALYQAFAHSPVIIATHCEDEALVKAATAAVLAQHGPNAHARLHPQARPAEACYASTSKAIALAKETGARLHVLHISTAEELELFDSSPLSLDKKITAEACVHHLWFTAAHYEELGNLIKCNPSIKEEHNRAAIRQALNTGKIDVIATDHAPHTLAEKQQPYAKAPAGLPLVQHSLNIALGLCDEGIITMERMVQLMCHQPAQLFQIDRRGYLREGYYADLVLIAPSRPWKVESQNVAYQCGWSPLQGVPFNHTIGATLVNGTVVAQNGRLVADAKVERLRFLR